MISVETFGIDRTGEPLIMTLTDDRGDVGPIAYSYHVSHRDTYVLWKEKRLGEKFRLTSGWSRDGERDQRVAGCVVATSRELISSTLGADFLLHVRTCFCSLSLCL